MGLGPLKGPSAHEGAKHRNGAEAHYDAGYPDPLFHKGSYPACEAGVSALARVFYED